MIRLCAFSDEAGSSLQAQIDALHRNGIGLMEIRMVDGENIANISLEQAAEIQKVLKDNQIQDSAFAPYFVDHTTGVSPTAASGAPWSAFSMQVKGDPMADLTEDLAAEQKARVTYDNILRLSDDPDVNDVIKFLREREIVHFQRFGEPNASM